MNRSNQRLVLRRLGNALKMGAGVAALTTAAWTLPALAQSTASQMDEIIVTGARNQPQIGGLIVDETAPKSRSTITQEYLSTQSAGQSALASINLLPGVNFTNNDSYGSSGGNLRMHGFDSARISLTLDGIPLNDTGNYAIYSNQLVDEELLNKVTVNTGTTDVDSPTASATGGTVNLQTRRPLDDAHAAISASVGSFNERRVFGVIDTGRFGPNGSLSAYISGSYQDYDKFKGSGDEQKEQVNAKIYDDLGGGDFIALTAHYNANRNYSYYTESRATIAQNYFADYGTSGSWVPQTATPGKADSPNSNDANYYLLHPNPSNTGNFRGQSRIHLSDDVMLTVDPYFEWTLANGGGTLNLKESDLRLIGNSKAKGVDLNGDGDFLDSVLVYAPSNTNTFRSGVTTSVIWQINDQNRFRLGYTLDYGRHRQTGDLQTINADGSPQDVFGSKYGNGIYSVDGTQLENRNRYSIAELNQVSAEYTWKGFDDKLEVVPALRMPFFTRFLNQYCDTYKTLDKNVGSLSANQYCTSGVVPANSQATNFYSAPFKQTKNFNEPLPSLGISYQVTDNDQIYFQGSEGFSAPKTDDLYGVLTDPNAVAPEKSYNFEVGERHQQGNLMTSIGGWYTRYINRIVSSLDPNDPTLTVDRSLGRVDLYGIDVEGGYRASDKINFYLSASWIHSEVKQNITSNGIIIPTQGKMLVDTPEYTVSARVDYHIIDPLSVGLEAKYTGERAATDVNDEMVTPFTVLNFDARYALPDTYGFTGSYLQFNINNLADKRYLNTISSSNTALGVNGVKGSTPYYLVGSPRAFMGTLHLEY